jgi:hypothetical protein
MGICVITTIRRDITIVDKLDIGGLNGPFQLPRIPSDA